MMFLILNVECIQTDGSFQSLYEQQFGVPVFQHTGIGAPEFDSSSWSTSSILSDVAERPLQVFLFLG